MRRVRDVFRLHFQEKRSQGEIARALDVGKTTVREYLHRLAKSSLSSWDDVAGLNDSELELRLGFLSAIANRKSQELMPDFNYLHRELSKKHVTLMLLWTEYREARGDADAYSYTQFRTHYNRWAEKLSVVMRQTHKAGEKTFIDYSGDGLWITDPVSGEKKQAQLFVATLGASSYTFAEVTWTQTLADWTASHTRMTKFFGGATELWVPDNLKSGVHKSDRYEPLLNETYRDCASHYGACVIPARANTPRDKAKVEVSVQIAQRWILARLRNRLFTSLAEANTAVAECLAILNAKVMRHLNKSRLELYEELDRPALKAFPQVPFEFAVWKKATVNIDYHIAFDHHHYSTPYQLVKELVDVRATATVIEIFHRGKRIASHRRSYKYGGYTTLTEHMPKSHREHAEWTPERVVRWAGEIGTNTSSLIDRILSSKKHPQQGFAAALGIIRLKDKYGRERLERASGRALELGAHSYRFVNEMLKNKMDQPDRQVNDRAMEPETNKETNEVQLALLSAENIRGAGYYH